MPPFESFAISFYILYLGLIQLDREEEWINHVAVMMEFLIDVKVQRFSYIVYIHY